jgi:O-antigen ligase
MEDISTMERLYRWVAGGHMVPYKPLTGWGPGNFTTFYRSHTVTSFRTYVSENPENSGVHNYFLMTLVEQGVPGLLIIIVLFSFTLLRGETLYHRWAGRPDRQRLVIMSLLSLVVTFAFLLINDLIETDKVGSFFFINLAILVNQEIAWQRYRAENQLE